MSAPITGPSRIVLTVAVLASFVAFLDGTIVNVALPAISRELGGGLVTQQWAVDAYLITLGALILLAGSVSDAFGRVLVIRLGLIGFGVASVAVGLAPDPMVLIAARALQGAAGAFLVPSSLALITSTFQDAAQARAIGIWTALTTAAMLVGPLLGGLLIDLASWRWAFFINVVPIAVTLFLVPRMGVHDVRQPGARVDWLGAALCAVGLGATVFALIEQARLGWGDPLVWGTGVGGVVLLVAFVLRQRRVASPMLPLELFRVRNFSAGNLATLLIYGALSLNGVVVAVYLQESAGLSATAAGLASLPSTVLLVLLSSRAGALAGRWGARIFMTVGPLVMAAGCLLLLTVAESFSYWWQVLPSMLVFGLGLALTVAPLTAAILGSIEAAHAGVASAVNNAVARIAGLLTIASLALIVAGDLDLAGLHRAAVVCAILMAGGGVVSWLGIRDTGRTRVEAA
ncbi:MFS transporter [Microbacterium saccharophilum]|uniref:MFS transporter n=1 Tax=Microbacterium saccharophilum TaxID=1213358 RepID=A0A5C8HSF7_9MICO|nr:MFS transporter [Microbacterium saccharophilum]TXK08884.1 MFS transporter [Microbacterium saccharophilum]GEP48099.1 MFS transporter [Microbacterium saccharophilum]